MITWKFWYYIQFQLWHLNSSPIHHWFWKSKLPWHNIFNLWQTKEQCPCFFLSAVTSLTRLTCPLKRRFLTTPILLPSLSLSPTLSGALPIPSFFFTFCHTLWIRWQDTASQCSSFCSGCSDSARDNQAAVSGIALYLQVQNDSSIENADNNRWHCHYDKS